MSARVNLLPREVSQRERGRRAAVLTGFLLLVFLVALGGLYYLKLQDVDAARAARDDAQDEVAALQAELATLQEFRELNDTLVARNELLAGAMATEISWARQFNDLALAFPGTSSLLTLSSAVETPADPQPGAVDFGEVVATITFTGYSIERVAPGVESVLIRFEDIPSFFNTYLQTAVEEEIGTTPVMNFSGSADLSPEGLTNRYENGLPLEGLG